MKYHVICCIKILRLVCVVLHVVVSPSGKPSIAEAAAVGRFPSMPRAECFPGAGGYRRPPGPAFMMPPHGPGMPIPRHGAYVLPPDGRGTSDLQTFVNRVHPGPPHSFPHDGPPPSVMGDMHGQRFPAGQKQLSYASVEQFSAAPSYTVPRDQPIKTEHPSSGVTQSAGLANGSPSDQGSAVSGLV